MTVRELVFGVSRRVHNAELTRGDIAKRHKQTVGISPSGVDARFDLLGVSHTRNAVLCKNRTPILTEFLARCRCVDSLREVFHGIS